MESMDMMDFLILDELVSEEESETRRRLREEEELPPEEYDGESLDPFDDL